ncbi:MAG: hypothetical protein K2X10_06845 [Hyphomicrobiales bacterium]|nr:hypothetical protein [Hyphomicrobiales bacterium]
MSAIIILLIIVLVLLAYSLWVALSLQRRFKRIKFIETFRWPQGLLAKLEAKHGLARKQSALIAQGLRQFFMAYLEGGTKYVAMPSQAVDELWHEFILFTRDYEDFCKNAFGSFLHHTPAVVLDGGENRDNAGLARVWHHCCVDEGIDARNPSRLPLLFALDTKFNWPGGYRYTPNCDALRRNGDDATQCASDFAQHLGRAKDAGYSNAGCSGGSDSSAHGDGDGGGCGGGGE